MEKGLNKFELLFKKFVLMFCLLQKKRAFRLGRLFSMLYVNYNSLPASIVLIEETEIGIVYSFHVMFNCAAKIK